MSPSMSKKEEIIRWVESELEKAVNEAREMAAKLRYARAVARSAEGLEALAELAFHQIKEKKRPDYRQIAQIWFTAALIRLPETMKFRFHLVHVQNNPLIRRDVVMGAFNLARGLDIYFDTERIEAMRLGIELLCEDEEVAIMVRPVIRGINLRYLLTLSLTMIGISPRTVKAATIEGIIKEIKYHPKNGVNEMLDGILEAIVAVAPTAGEALMAIYQSC